ncbi:MAG: hypothetical protein ACRD2P_18700, partial [Terriglobia bacterium]
IKNRRPEAADTGVATVNSPYDLTVGLCAKKKPTVGKAPTVQPPPLSSWVSTIHSLKRIDQFKRKARDNLFGNQCSQSTNESLPSKV